MLNASMPEPASETVPPLSPAARLGIVVPTYNAARHWPALQAALSRQAIGPGQILIIDSSSQDDTRALAEASGYRVEQIAAEDFGHGRTRQLALRYFPEADALLFLTQDAVPDTPHSLKRLAQALQDPGVGAAYGRQLPRPGADAIERHARFFNYPETSAVRTLESRATLGIKAAFLSNSFAVYRRTALEAIGGFPEHVIFGEDSYAAAKLLLAGWKIVYQADATVIHSHHFSPAEEFHRYFDIGVHHDRESWLLQTFGAAGGEGLNFVRSELRYLMAHDKAKLPIAMLRTLGKLSAYRIGRLWRRLPASVNRQLSSNRGFWQ